MYDVNYCYRPLTDKVFQRYWRGSEGVREVKRDVWLWNGVEEQAARVLSCTAVEVDPLSIQQSFIN